MTGRPKLNISEERLIELRKIFGYDKIAKELGCSKSLVKKYCKRLGLTGQVNKGGRPKNMHGFISIEKGV